MGDRRAHLVGSIPAATAAKAMRLAVERLVLVARTPSALRPALAGLLARRISALAQGVGHPVDVSTQPRPA